MITNHSPCKKNGNYITEGWFHQDLSNAHQELKLKLWQDSLGTLKKPQQLMKNSKTHEQGLIKKWNITHSPSSLPSSGRRHFFLCCFSWDQPVNQPFIGHLPFIEHLLHHKDPTCGKKMSQSKRSLTFQGIDSVIQILITCMGTWTDLAWQLVTGTSLGSNLVLKATRKLFLVAT